MNNIIFITGMAGAGKSTVGRHLARHFPKCLFIQVDELREKIDDVCAPPNFVEQYAALFEIPEVHRILLYPKAPIVIERIKQRGGPWEHINYVPAIYDFLDSMSKDGWIVLDSSEWTIEQTVIEVLSNIALAPGNV